MQKIEKKRVYRSTSALEKRDNKQQAKTAISLLSSKKRRILRPHRKYYFAQMAYRKKLEARRDYLNNDLARIRYNTLLIDYKKIQALEDQKNTAFYQREEKE